MIIRPDQALPHPGGHGEFLHPRQHDLPLLTVAQLRQAEADAYAHMPSFTLMACAGEAAWNWARHICAQDARPWLILAGTGNNGGDAFVLASHAHRAGIPVSIYTTGQTGASANDAARARSELEAAGISVFASETLTDLDADRWACIVDGLLGIGAQHPPRGEVARLIELANAARHPRVLALDIPSGLDAHTGAAAQPCLHATHTLSFIAAKPGLFTAEGPDVCGQTTVATLGLQIHAQTMTAWADSSLLSLWPQRRMNSHKGLQGDVVILGGDAGMAGAAVLAGRAAVQMGAGRVFLALLDGPHPPGYDPVCPEMMLRHAESLTGHTGVWVIGPGAGQSERMQLLLRQLLRQWHDTPETVPLAIVLDADALNLIAADPALAVRLQSLQTLRIITPHPLEAARLLGRSAGAIQADRPAVADALARQLDAVVVLKGMGSVISDGTEKSVNLTGGPALASGGTGDVLAGTIGALLAQMLTAEKTAQASESAPGGRPAVIARPLPTAWKAAALATFLHGATCDQLTGETGPPPLLNASELPARMRMVLMKKQTVL